MKNYSATTVDDYITNAPKEAQAKLKELRGVIKSAVPKAEETISWGVPFYKYHGLLSGFASFKEHISFGLTDVLDVRLSKSLQAKGYITKKKIIQINFDQKVPSAEIKQILKTKAKQNEEKNRKKSERRIK